MTSAQVALNGLQRCLNYTQVQRDSESSFYSSSVESLEQIRDLAFQIMVASNEALAKVGLDKPLSIVETKSSQSDEILKKAAEISGQVASEVANQVVIAVLNQFNVINQQNISINHVDHYNQYNEIDAQEIIDENLGETTKIEGDILELPGDLDKSSKKSSFIHDFKDILRKVHNLPVDKFSSPEVKVASDLVFDYFEVRFNKKYDPTQIHWFSREKFRDYLVSILIKYSQSVVAGESFKFYDDFENWLKELTECPSKYTLPLDCFEIYYNLLEPDPAHISVSLKLEELDVFKKIWSELWELGYHKFSSFSYKFNVPDASVSWVACNLQSAVEYVGIKEDAVSSAICALGELWKSLETTYVSFDICRAIVIRSNPILQTINYEDTVKLSSDIIQKSLLAYVNYKGIGSIDRLKMKLKSIISIVEIADSKYDTLEEKYGYLSQFPPSDLELVEVLEHYAANIAEVDNNEI